MVRRILIGAAAALLLLVGACASQVAETPQQRVFALQSDYNGVLNLAVAYESQPRCTATVTTACSNPAVVAEIRRGDIATDAAIKAAQNTVRAPGVSNSTIELSLVGAANALGAFRTILTTYNIGRR